MAFLYVGLGLAMISGISAMMQIGNNINNLQNLSSFKQNEYFQTSLPIYDKKILKFLNNYSGLDSEVCLKIRENFSETNYKEGEIRPKNTFFAGSCVLVNTELNHRVLIKKSEEGNLSLFSCYFKRDPYCPYEVDR